MDILSDVCWGAGMLLIHNTLSYIKWKVVCIVGFVGLYGILSDDLGVVGLLGA